MTGTVIFSGHGDRAEPLRSPCGASAPGAHRDSVQRRLPLHGLAPHGAAAADRDRSSDAALPGEVAQAVLAPRHLVGPDDRGEIFFLQAPFMLQGISKKSQKNF